MRGGWHESEGQKFMEKTQKKRKEPRRENNTKTKKTTRSMNNVQTERVNSSSGERGYSRNGYEGYGEKEKKKPMTGHISDIIRSLARGFRNTYDIPHGGRPRELVAQKSDCTGPTRQRKKGNP